MNKVREIFSNFHADKRVREHINTTRETYQHEPLYADAAARPKRKKEREANDWSNWEKRQTTKRQTPYKALMTQILRPNQQCTHPACRADNSYLTCLPQAVW